MKADEYIVFMYNQIPAIYFPVGKLEDGGSCEFMTEECFEYCPSLVKNEHEVRVMKYFIDNKPTIIIDKILSDLSFYGSMHIIWFEWGDCPSMLEDKICEVLIRLSEIGIIQNVYTRNKSFWKKVPFTNSLRIVYRTETVEDAIALSLSSGKLTCCPNLDEGKAWRIEANGMGTAYFEHDIKVIIDLLEDLDYGNGYIITKHKMDEEKYKALPEFMGF